MAEWKEMYNELKQALDDVLKTTTQHGIERGLILASSAVESDGVSSATVSELQKKLRQKDEELNATKKKLSNAQERLTVLEQATIATRRRELQQEGIYDKMIGEGIYYKLQPEEDERNISDELRSNLGWFVAIFFLVMYIIVNIHHRISTS